MLTREEIEKIFTFKKARWLYNYRAANPTFPHAKLTSDFCADGYYRCDLVLADPYTAGLFAENLVELIASRGIAKRIQWVVSSAYGGIIIAYEVARRLGAYHAYTVKDPGSPKRQLWRGRIPLGAVVLRCEDVISTRKTVDDVTRAIQEGNPEPVTILPEVATIISHPYGGAEAVVPSIYLFLSEVRIWPTSECPLCRQGSEALPPKEHWWDRFVLS